MISTMKRSLVLAAILAASASLLIRASVPTPPPNTWAATSDMAVARAGASSVLMNDGSVLITGGTNGAGPTASGERYVPAAGEFVSVPPMQTARANHTSTLLPNGRVLVAGGVGADSRALSAAEIYDPNA